MEIRSIKALVAEDSIDVERRALRALASVGTLDRAGEIIEPAAFERSLEVYRANPVIMAGHVYGGASGEPTVIGRATKIHVEPDGLPFEMQFAETDLADQYWQLYRGGFMRAFSVGFLPGKSDTRQVDGRAARVHTEVELLEISAVAVPANRDSLVAARSATDAERLCGSMLAELERERRLERIIQRTLESVGDEMTEVLAAAIEERLAAWGLCPPEELGTPAEHEEVMSLVRRLAGDTGRG